MKISTILDQIDLGSMALPTFQRGYVWNRDQVRGLMRSLYRKHPVGSLLVWVTKTEGASTRGDGDLAPGSVKLILDGQQRITTLYGVVRGKPPRFFEGNAQAFMGLFFNMEEETFEFYAPLKMKNDPLWIDVTELMEIGAGAAIARLAAVPSFVPKLPLYANRVNAIDAIKQVDLHIEEVTGEDKTVDVVVDIFNVVNSGGTKLQKGDLALAKIGAQWPEARDTLRGKLKKWERAGFFFDLDWLLRCTNAVVTGVGTFAALKDVATPTLQQGIQKTEKHIDSLLNLISARLGLDHDRVLGSRYAFPVMTRYLNQRGGHLGNYRERDKLLYWYIHTLLWGRYAGSTETVITQDLRLLDESSDGALDRLIAQLRQNRGDLALKPEDFLGWSQSSRFYPLLYMMTRVWKAQDWESGYELSSHLLGKLSRLQVHHIFPRAMLYKHNYSRSEVNAVANFTFLTQETNLRVSDREPAVYLEEYAAKFPGAVDSHWIPMDRQLWQAGRYRDFLAARRDLMAKAANDFLTSLFAGSVPKDRVVEAVLERGAAIVPGAIESDQEEQLIQHCNDWIVEQGLPHGQRSYELLDPDTTEPLAMIDLAWPDGLQAGLSMPVALLLGEGDDVKAILNRLGYRYFADLQEFQDYVRREVLVLNGA